MRAIERKKIFFIFQTTAHDHTCNECTNEIILHHRMKRCLLGMVSLNVESL